MDFTLSSEQEELKREARSFLAARLPAPRVAELADSPEGWDPASWRELAELGWLGITLTEAEGGAGLGWVEQAIVFEELGRVLYPGPYFSTVALALPALPASMRADVACGRLRWSAEVDGLVPDLALVDRVLTEEGIAEPRGETLETLDGTRRYGRLNVKEREPPPALIDLTHAFVALAAEAVGVASRALELSVEYASQREQFGRKIGSFQAVSHPLSDIHIEVAMASAHAAFAAWCLDSEPSKARIAALSAKAFAADTAVRATERAIQVLGGVGYTWEHPIHRYYKRALWIASFGGYPATQRALVAAELLDGD